MSSLLSDDDLSYMQDTQETAMPGTVYILTLGSVPNGMGGFTETWGTAGTVIGRIYPMLRKGLAEVIAGEQVTAVSDWFFTAPVGTVVTAKDRVEYNGRSWEILRVNNDQMWKTAVRAELQSLNEEDRV